MTDLKLLDEPTVIPADAWAITLEGKEIALLIPQDVVDSNADLNPFQLAIVACGLRLRSDPAFLVEMAMWMEKRINEAEEDNGEEGKRQ